MADQPWHLLIPGLLALIGLIYTARETLRVRRDRTTFTPDEIRDEHEWLRNLLFSTATVTLAAFLLLGGAR